MNRNFRGKPRHRGGKKFFHNSKKHFTPRNRSDFQKRSTPKGSKNEERKFVVSDAMNRLKEKDVGITEYYSDHKGFNGVIKQIYEDFHVNEIDCDGNIITLTSTEPPETKVDQANNEPESEEHLKSIVSPEAFEKIKDLVNEKEGNKTEVEIEVTEMDKDDRRKLHNAIKAVGGGHLISNTKQKDEKKVIVITKHNKGVKCDRRVQWPSCYGGDYVHFVLYKENLDTMETVNLIASKLRIKPNMITYAGTKDRRGVTSQMMSILRIEPKKLADLNSGLHGVSLGNYSFKTKGLKLGDLKGNQFRIVLRNVTGNEEEIKQAVTSLSEHGFINYYGLQRFGSSVSVPTYAVGKALLQGDWKLAVELILKPREGELNRALAEARNIWSKTRDANAALKVLPNKEKLIEGRLLIGLSQCAANDYVNALEQIPRNTRLLYLHSYQSLVWNKVVSRRVKELGIKPISGDLVFLNDAQPEIDDDDDDAEDEGSENSESVKNTVKKNIVKAIVEDDLASMDIHDIVMPLPGHDVVYPNNVMKEWYEEILLSDGLSSSNLKQTVRKYSVGGAYRKMMIRPDNLSWKTMHYSNPFKKLELSDKDKIKKIESPKDEPNGTYKALILDFCLPSSTYATMALREILKSDTSSQHQASLNNYHIKKEQDISSGSSEECVNTPSATCTSIKPINLTESDKESSPNDQNKMLVDDVNGHSEITSSNKPELCDNDVNGQSEITPNKPGLCDEGNDEEIKMQNEAGSVKESDNDMQIQAINEKSKENTTRKREGDDTVEAVEEKKMKLETNMTD